jgi:HD-like signal output (HDOD) protein
VVASRVGFRSNFDISSPLQDDDAITFRLAGNNNNPVQHLIGLKNLMPLIFSISLGGLFNRLAMPPDERAMAFRGSLLKAFVARRIAAITGDEAQAEEAFLCALFMDVGLPVFYAAERSSWLETQSIIDIQDSAVRREREERIYGIDHAAVGQLVAERMGLPPLFAHAIAHHHSGYTALAEQLSPAVARAVDFAATVQHRFATTQQSAMADAGVFHHTVLACMESRGYSVR